MMNGKEKIERKLFEWLGRQDDAHQVWKGHGASGYGWYWQPFGREAEFIGQDVQAALDYFQHRIDERE